MQWFSSAPVLKVILGSHSRSHFPLQQNLIFFFKLTVEASLVQIHIYCNLLTPRIMEDAVSIDPSLVSPIFIDKI